MKVRWLVLGCGSIAGNFMRDMPFVADGVVEAVASRSKEKAAAFAEKYSVAKSYGSYAEAVKDPDIDAVYIATPHPMHIENALLCIEAGKAVLCEKPLTVNAKEAKILINAAREKKVFLMEAMWTRFLPSTKKFIELIRSGAIGEVRSASINFGFSNSSSDEHRLFNPDLGGGALLDVGIYVVSMASLIFNQLPKSISSQAAIGRTGVDINDSISFNYGDGKVASLQCSVSSYMTSDATVSGTKGHIQLCYPIHCSKEIKVTRMDNMMTTSYPIPFNCNGFNYEIQSVCECIKQGKIENEVMPLDETLSIMQTLDEIRKPWGVVYPCEKQ